MEVGLEGKSLLSRRTFPKKLFHSHGHFPTPRHMESTEHYSFRSDPATEIDAGRYPTAYLMAKT